MSSLTLRAFVKNTARRHNIRLKTVGFVNQLPTGKRVAINAADEIAEDLPKSGTITPEHAEHAIEQYFKKRLAELASY